ncbi:polysaccharide pyruvyl transferase family protein [Arthrobacter sp. IK3]|uniref:polysaccharide pyruvyl transferase family protein n=1 Tax=Arthrobacter sp. IK3 TaxID=3448169 RepID=UPI003EE0E8A7
MARPVIYLIGTSGHPNFGDEFITAAWIKYIAETAPEAEVWLDSPQPGASSTLFAGMHPHLFVTDTLWRAVSESSHLPVEEVGSRVRNLVTNLGSPAFDLGLLKLREARSLHLVGGGYLNGVWPHHFALTDAMRAVKELTGAKLFATGHGLMPVPGGLTEPAEFFRDFDYVSVRDQDSAQQYGVPLGVDDAFLGAASEIGRDTPEADGMFVCIQSDMTDTETFEKTIAGVRPIIERAISEGKPVSYVEAIPGVDHAAFARLSDLIPGEKFIPFAHIWQHGLPLSAHQEWVTTRFHFHLLASAAGAKGIALGIRPGYYDIKHRSLVELGSGWHYAAADRDAGAGVAAPSGGTLSDQLPRLTARKRAEADKLYSVQSAPQSQDRTGRATLLSRIGAARRR